MGNTGVLGELEQMILLAILQLKNEGFGTEVMRELEKRGDRKISRGALYVTLDRMEHKGLISSTVGDPVPGRGGRPRRYLAVTKAGVRALRKNRTVLMRMWEGLEPVFGDS